MNVARLLVATGQVLALAATGAAAAASAPVTAATVSDPRGDVKPKRQGWDKGMDIQRVRYAKSGDNLKIKIEVRDLNAVTSDLTYMYYGARIHTRTDMRYWLHTTPASTLTVHRVRNYRSAECRGSDVRLSPTTDSVRLTVPLRCLDRPHRISVEATSIQYTTEFDTPVARDYSKATRVIDVR